MADGDISIHPALERMALRRQMMAAVDQPLDAVVLLVRELDSDTPDPDLEPSLGALRRTASQSWRERHVAYGAARLTAA